MGFDNWKIQHVNHTTVQESRITMAREYFGHVIVCAFFKNDSVEHAVNQIAECAGENQACTNYVPIVIFFLYQGSDIIDTKDYGCKAKKGQKHFAEISTEFPTPGHAFVFHKKKLEFFAQYVNSVVIWR